MTLWPALGQSVSSDTAAVVPLTSLGSPMPQFDPIAVVSMGCAFPGAPDPDVFWTRIVDGEDATAPVPQHRWQVPVASMVAGTPVADRALSDRACLIGNMPLDVDGLALPAEMIRPLDPLYHLLIHAARQASRGCRLLPALAPERISTILAAIALPTDHANRLNDDTVGWAYRQQLTGSKPLPGEPVTDVQALGARVTSLPAALTAACFGWTGGSFTLDAACASSLYAVKLACDELQAHRADAVVTGGVSRPDCLYTQVGFSQLRALSPSGRCAPFSRRADGLVVGEGAGVVVLKRLADAVSHKDTIFGIIRGIGLSNDMRGNLLAPDSEGQLRAMRRAYETAGWSPNAVDHIECHGAGTPVGDATELSSLSALWDGLPHRAGQCAIGSVKSMIGHLLTAAGAAGLIKSLLALHHETLPPSLKSLPPADHPALTTGPFHVQTTADRWPQRDDRLPRRAAVSAFGFGGINAHLLLEQWVPQAEAHDVLAVSIETAKAAPVAIIGLAVHCGAAETTERFSDMMAGGSSAFHAARAERWYGVADAVAGAQRIALPPGGYLSQVVVPQGRYRIPPAELPDILPQHLLMLTVAADAMEDAGLPLRAERPRMGGVIGIDFDMEATDFHLRWQAGARAAPWGDARDNRIPPWDAPLAAAVHPPLTAPRTLGALGGIIASRIAREFGFGGPSFIVSADAAGGCRALEIGVRSLQKRETDLFLVGAVDLAGDIRRMVMDHPFLGYGAGSAPGDAAVALVLKRFDDAIAGGDVIYGTIAGIGRAGGGAILPHAPSREAYTRSLDMALDAADLDIARVGLWEIHGSGVAQEDALEAAVLNRILQRRHAAHDTTGANVHSITAQAGHCGAAAGLLSVAAAAVSLRHRRLPAVSGTQESRGAGIEPPVLSRAHGDSAPWPKGAGNEPSAAVVAAITKDGNVMHVVLAAGPVERTISGKTPQPATKAPPPEGMTRRIGKPPFAAPVEAIPISPPSALPDAAKTSDPTPVEETAELDPPPGVTLPLPPDPLADTFRMAAGTIAAGSAAVADAHQRFLEVSRDFTDTFADAVNLKSRLMAVAETESASSASVSDQGAPVTSESNASPRTAAQKPVFTREQCLAFAVGSAAGVLGPAFADVDGYRTRVRLPDEPLMLVDRIMAIEGAKDSLGAGRVVTAHDVLQGVWYLDGDRAPVSISVEAGQADLFLCAYLGIDHRVQGHRSYRLLDATVTFHRDLPRPGETIRYDIHIDKFIRQQETYLFFFRFEGTIDDAPFITMTNGCAGFFTPEEVRRSGGIILTEEEKAAATGRSRVDWMPPVALSTDAYDAAALDALREGRLEACFGADFSGISLAEGLRLPGGRMRLIHRIRRLEPTGGQYGLGRIEAEADIAPDDWFLTCHFIDDMTMPGTLMYDCCAHALRVLLQRLGWVSAAPEAHYAPLTGQPAVLRCRGPVTPETRQVFYAVDIKEIGYGPEPYAIADAHMVADGRYIVMFRDMSIRMVGVSKSDLQNIWKHRHEGVQAVTDTPPAPVPMYDYERILAFSIGSPSTAFGSPYQPFDNDRRIARLPGPPYLFMSRVTAVAPPPWKLAPGDWITAQYDITGDEWYFRADRSGVMPFCVLLEIALQPCGWLAAYCGSALKSDTDLKFRNLGGDAILHRSLGARPQCLTMRSRLTKVSEAGEMIIEHFDFEVLDAKGPVYTGSTYFGFFTAAALANQVGFKNVKAYMDGAASDTPVSTAATMLPHRAPKDPKDPSTDVPDGLCLSGRALLMVDAVDIVDAGGGAARLGYLRARKTVDPEAWFFAAHFFQDPVCPGSLGVESFLQTLRLQARNRWPELRRTHRFELAPGHRHQWAYRGQVIPKNSEIVVESEVSAIDTSGDPALYGHGFLWCDGLCIYEMKDFGIRLVPMKNKSV